MLLGPRQVGKTTLISEIAEELQIPYHYASADLATLRDVAWLQVQWNVARQLGHKNEPRLLIVDEIQKISDWSSAVKALWDEDTRQKTNLVVVLLGSSPWLLQKGLGESLAGRFELLPVTHWTFAEMREAFHFGVEEFVFFGGYPGAAPLIDSRDLNRWSTYINDSLIETTISRDILLMTQVNKPALLRRLFQLGCIYSGQVLSYTKMLGQLQDAGNTTTLSHYLELLDGAWVLSGLEKFAMQPFRRRASSPKFQAYNTALITSQLGITFDDARNDKELWGRLVESCVGAHLLALTKQNDVELFYWREGDREVDFILKRADHIVAIEVKSGRKKEAVSGLSHFVKEFKPHRALVVGEQGISLDRFLLSTIDSLF